MTLSFAGFRVPLILRFISDCHTAVFVAIVSLPLLATVGCQSAIAPVASNSAAKVSPTASIRLSPENLTVAPGARVQFAALVTNDKDTAVNWSANSGVISETGVFTVPNGKAGTVFQILATSRANFLVQGATTVAITAPSSNGNSSSSGSSSSASSSSSSGSSPSGSSPSGSSSSGSSSSSSSSGPDNRYCDVGDVPNFGSADGPASAPTACYQTSEASTPSAGAVIQIAPNAKIQTAIDNATCGDTLVLQAGKSYSGFSLPAKNCDAGRYITISSSALGSGLPGEGVRATPCNAGIASLPGRPALNCTSVNNVMAQIAGVARASHIITTAPGANYYRLVGLEIADTGANGAKGGFYDLVMLTNADHIIFDRCWIHGSPVGEDVKGVAFTSSSYVAVIDSYISDIHSKVSGYGADSVAIGSVTGTGPVKIVNNFLEAAGENILWGGGGSSTNVTDVELRRNHMFKPFTWWESSPSYFGTLFVVKNLFENKSGIRQMVEGNIFENNWAQAQKGTAILFYSKNQFGKCPGCTVHDIIFRYNIVRHVVNGINIAATYATTCPGHTGNSNGCQFLSGPLYNFSIHDNLLDDINEKTYWPGGCCTGGALFEIDTYQATNWAHDISIDHNTGFPVGSGIANITIRSAPEVITNFAFTNNLVGSGKYGFHQVLPGKGLPGCGATNASGAIGALNGCMGNTWTFTHNGIVGSSSSVPGAPYPESPNCGALSTCLQFNAPDLNNMGLVNFNNGNGGDYHLLLASPFKNAGSDGKDLGADIDALTNATAGVL